MTSDLRPTHQHFTHSACRQQLEIRFRVKRLHTAPCDDEFDARRDHAYAHTSTRVCLRSQGLDRSPGDGGYRQCFRRTVGRVNLCLRSRALHLCDEFRFNRRSRHEDVAQVRQCGLSGYQPRCYTRPNGRRAKGVRCLVLDGRLHDPLGTAAPWVRRIDTREDGGRAQCRVKKSEQGEAGQVDVARCKTVHQPQGLHLGREVAVRVADSLRGACGTRGVQHRCFLILRVTLTGRQRCRGTC